MLQYKFKSSASFFNKFLTSNLLGVILFEHDQISYVILQFNYCEYQSSNIKNDHVSKSLQFFINELFDSINGYDCTAGLWNSSVSGFNVCWWRSYSRQFCRRLQVRVQIPLLAVLWPLDVNWTYRPSRCEQPLLVSDSMRRHRYSELGCIYSPPRDANFQLQVRDRGHSSLYVGWGGKSRFMDKRQTRCIFGSERLDGSIWLRKFQRRNRWDGMWPVGSLVVEIIWTLLCTTSTTRLNRYSFLECVLVPTWQPRGWHRWRSLVPITTASANYVED